MLNQIHKLTEIEVGTDWITVDTGRAIIFRVSGSLERITIKGGNTRRSAKEDLVFTDLTEGTYFVPIDSGYYAHTKDDTHERPYYKLKASGSVIVSIIE